VTAVTCKSVTYYDDVMLFLELCSCMQLESHHSQQLAVGHALDWLDNVLSDSVVVVDKQLD